MQEELNEIIKQLQERYFHYGAYEQHQNQSFDAQLNQYFCREEKQQNKEKIKMMQQTIQSLLQYGLRINKLYEEAIHEGAINFNDLKVEKQEMEHLLKEQVQQTKRMVNQLVQQIEQMKKQISRREQNEMNLLEKYQELMEKQRQVCGQYDKDIVQMQNHFRQEIQQMKYIMQFKQHTLNHSIQQNHQIKLQNLNFTTQNEALRTQNDNLRQVNAYLSESQKKLIDQNKHLQKQILSLQQKIDDLTLNRLSSKYDDAQSIKSHQKFTFEVNRSNGSRYIVNFNQEKSLLNISQNYIQSFQSFHVKVNESQQHIEEGIVRRSKFVKNTIFQILQKEEEAADKSVKKQQSSVESSAQLAHAPNPYESFFSLLVQSQKLNSPQFNKIARVNLSHLYNEFVEKMIPFNKWQVEIKKQLESKKYLRKGHK